MVSKKIFVPIDFTTTSEQSAKQATSIAVKANYPITLFHVITNESSNKGENAAVLDKLKERAETVKINGVVCDSSVVKGNIFDEIPKAANQIENQLMVIGTHGIQGIKQKLLGADMLKLIRKINIPCLVVQSDCICRDYSPIVFPVGGHEGFEALVEATAMIAKLYGSEVHLYSVIRKGDDGSKKLRDNTLMAMKYFEDNKISCKRVQEETTVFSVGYAKQTLQYANKVNAGLIAMMSVKTEEYYYFAQADKETMINNEFKIPVLCSNGLMND
jgi:nucleotide-binding universal stress UspA family protein